MLRSYNDDFRGWPIQSGLIVHSSSWRAQTNDMQGTSGSNLFSVTCLLDASCSIALIQLHRHLQPVQLQTPSLLRGLFCTYKVSWLLIFWLKFLVDYEKFQREMPQPSVDSGDDLSLRHLPDVSDLDFSFQIPGAIRGDNLLADDDLDFFKGADVSIAPPASPPPTEPPGQLTHKLKAEKLPASKDGRKLASSPTLSYGNSEDHDTDPKQKKANPHELGKGTTSVNVLSRPKPKVITSNAAKLPSCEGSPAAVRLDNLRAELNLFGDNLLVGPSTSANHQELSVAFHHHKPKGILKKSLEKKQQRISPRNNQVCRYPFCTCTIFFFLFFFFFLLRPPTWLTARLLPTESDQRRNH